MERMPPKPRRDRQFLLKLSATEKRQLTRLSRKHGLTLSDTMRLMLRQEYELHFGDSAHTAAQAAS